MSRRDEIAANLTAVRERIQRACADAGRRPSEVTLIAVTKTFPSSDVRLLHELGVADVAENRDQEARPKHEACAGLPLRWHFVGQLQRNKARSVASYADVVHSVDSVALATALARAATDPGRQVMGLVQVSLDGAPGRGGAGPDEVAEVADAIAGSSGLRLGGVMAVAPLGADPDEAFARLEEVSVRLRRSHPGATVVSAGMSGDLDSAIRHGATHVRVGTALLGRRATPVG